MTNPKPTHALSGCKFCSHPAFTHTNGSGSCHPGEACVCPEFVPIRTSAPSEAGDEAFEIDGLPSLAFTEEVIRQRYAPDGVMFRTELVRICHEFMKKGRASGLAHRDAEILELKERCARQEEHWRDACRGGEQLREENEELKALAGDCYRYLQSIEEGLPPGAPSVGRFERALGRKAVDT